MRTLQIAVMQLLLAAISAQAQIDQLPAEVQQVLREVGPAWSQDISGNIDKTQDALTAALQHSP